MSQTVLALLVALVSVLTVFVGELAELAGPRDSHVRVRFLWSDTHRLSLLAFNLGPSAAAVLEARLFEVGSDPRRLRIEAGRIIHPEETQEILFFTSPAEFPEFVLDGKTPNHCQIEVVIQNFSGSISKERLRIPCRKSKQKE